MIMTMSVNDMVKLCGEWEKCGKNTQNTKVIQNWYITIVADIAAMFEFYCYWSVIHGQNRTYTIYHQSLIKYTGTTHKKHC